MDYAEEQENERDALEAIYMEDYSVQDDGRVKLALEPFPGEDAENHETYPEVLPEIEILIKKGLNESQLKEIKQLLSSEMEDYLGAPMIYDLAEILKGWLVDHNEASGDGSEYEQMMARMNKTEKVKIQKELKEKESRKREEAAEVLKQRENETPVTAETFLAWRAAFDAEIGSFEKVVDKATGRMIFENNVDSVTKLEEDLVEEDIMEEDDDSGVIDASLFLDDEDDIVL